ncbi:hypothetical protein DV736_g949, partial [Chaetothyriales sp. CBS 134916]
MGKKPKKTLEEEAWEAHEAAAAQGYTRGAHEEADKRPVAKRPAKKTLRGQEGMLQGLTAATEDELRALLVGKGVKAPPVETIKDFTRYYAKLKANRGNIVEQMTVDSLRTSMEWFFAGFYRHTGYDYSKDDRSETYRHVKYGLTNELLLNGEPLVVDVHIVKYNLGAKDADRILRTLWTHDDLVFTAERHRLNFHARLLTHCETGARVAALDDIQWKDIEFVLHFPEESARARWIYKLSQRKVKNNRDPKHNSFGTPHKDDPRLIYNTAAIYLAMAVADGVLLGDPSIEQLFEFKRDFQRGDDATPLHYKPGMETLPVYRACTMARGLEPRAMSQSMFCNIYRHNMRNAGYNYGASIHAIRRAVGAAVDERYTETIRCQLLTQADRNVFGRDYTARVVRADTGAAFRSEPAETSHFEHFVSVDQFRRTGMPVELPAAAKYRLQTEDSGMLQHRKQVKEYLVSGQHTEFQAALQRLRKYRDRLFKEELETYRETWTRQRDIEALLTPRHLRAAPTPRTEMAAFMRHFIPERERIAQEMVSKAFLSDEELKPFMADLVSLCWREQNMVYAPTLEPVDGKCPVDSCRRDLTS